MESLKESKMTQKVWLLRTKYPRGPQVSVIEFDLKQIEMHYRTTTEPTSRVLEFFVTFSVANGGFMLILEFILW